jgi:hypothetical protein
MKLFIYNVIFPQTTDGNSNTTTLTLGSDYNFEVAEIRTTGTGNVRVQIKETSGNQFSNSPFNANVVGAGQNGFKLPERVVLEKGTQIDFTITNNSGSTISAGNFEVDLIGYKLAV